MLELFDVKLTSHLFLGTSKYPNLDCLLEAIHASRTEVVTTSLRRESAGNSKNNIFWQTLQNLKIHLLPNSAGCHNAVDAIATAEMARELFSTNWIKLEVIGDDYTLQPDMFELVKAAETLIQRGFKVFPYCTDDLIACKKLIDVGCEVLMPWASPIGSGQGILNPFALNLLRERLPNTRLIVDAGIGRPSDATKVMELGYDAVLLNSAVALAKNPVLMASAFASAVEAGFFGYKAGIIPAVNRAKPSTAVIDTPFWHQV